MHKYSNSSSNRDDARSALRKHASPAKAKIIQRFFKTAPGEYGEGDIFIGISVPNIRKVAKAHTASYAGTRYAVPLHLLRSPIHEERLLALLIMVDLFEKGDISQKEKVFNEYIKNIKYINNWDLVDVTAPKIVGAWMHMAESMEHGGVRGKPYALCTLRSLAGSGNLWERRIAIVSTFYFIRKNELKITIDLCEKLLEDKEDLMHKACGWMLREVGKKKVKTLEKFIKKNYVKMPRTMLRYAIEKFSESKRKRYLKGIF